MNEKELRKRLNQPYTQDNWKEVVDFVFPNVSELSSNQHLPIEPKHQDKIESFKQLGSVRLNDGKNLALFELKLKENVNIIRNRVALNDIVSSYIDQEQIHGVLSIFEQGKDDYRFTFSARSSQYDEDAGDFVTKKTDTKRYTYVLGKNESCKTPALRFYDLSQKKDEADIKAIEAAFSVETLSKNFFKEYKQQYELFVDYLTKTPSYYTAVFNNNDKAIRDWVKLLLGRLVFIKFVQKKGWLGVPAEEAGWQYGNYRFLEESFEIFEHQDNFYSQFLNPLFFEGFDAPNRPNAIFELTGTKIPFLSGGLFDNEDPKTKTINFPKAYFEGLFEFLEKYNFTIDENDLTMDKEVGIDPEMLGHIFENLLEDNKDKGAFYTPKEIVRYMCQESLKEYLKTYLQEHKQWSNHEDKQQELEAALHNFITKKEAGHVIDLDATLAQALKDVKICDPAIGSGAFPMGLLNEIFQLVHKLYDASPDKVGAIWEMDTWQPDVVKLNIIQQSIYGVDIEKGAVEIARLRFWLSLVVDSDEPHALPHLDYKIVVGDSLVSKLEDTVIDIDWELTDENAQTTLYGNEFVIKRKALLDEITTKQSKIFDPDCDDEALSLEIRDLKIELLKTQLNLMVKTQGLEDKPTIQGRNFKKQTELWLETLKWKDLIKNLEKMKKGSKTPLEFFDWKLDFPEIMNPEITDKTGFDIIIANPPYLDYREINKEVLASKDFPICKSSTRPNLYQYFVELSDMLLDDNGVFCFINPNQFLSTNNGLQLRSFLLENKEIRFIVDVSYIKIFEEASTYTIVWLYRNKKASDNKIRINRCLKLSDINKSSFVISQNETNNISGKIIPLSIDYFKLQKIEKNKKILGEIANLKWGTSSSGYGARKISEADFLRLNSHEQQLYRPILQTADIKKYYIDWKEEYIPIDIYSDNIISEFNKDKLLIARVTKKIQASLDYDNRYVGKATVLTDAELELKTLLALINSSFVNHWYYLKFETTHMAGGYLRFDIPYLSQIPIPKIPKKSQEKLIELVSEINDRKSFDINIDISGLEQQIDDVVYKLYDLTYDEVLVIEPAFSERMSKKEYEALEVE